MSNLNKVQLLRLDWSQHKPTLVLKSGEDEPFYFPLTSGNDLSLEFVGKRICTGYRGPCPEARIIKEGREHQCFPCRSQETSYYDFTGRARTHAPTAQRLETTPHQLYLAFYTNNKIKVGVTSRGLTRLLEQGATGVLFLAEGDGLNMRDVEKRISKLEGLTDRVQMATRIQALSGFVPEKDVRDALAKTAAFLATQVPEIGEDLQFGENFYYLASYYKIADGIKAKLIRGPFSREEIATGQIVGVLGQLLVLRNPNTGNIALDFVAARGHIVNLSSRIPQDIKSCIVGEQTLF